MTPILCTRCHLPFEDEPIIVSTGGAVHYACLTPDERAHVDREELGRDCREPIDDQELPF